MMCGSSESDETDEGASMCSTREVLLGDNMFHVDEIMGDP